MTDRTHGSHSAVDDDDGQSDGTLSVVVTEAQSSKADAREALLSELRPLVEKAAGPNGWDWMFPIRVKPVDGKPTIVSHKGGNLFRGYIATWQEADLLVALANAAPRILAALADRPSQPHAVEVLRQALENARHALLGASLRKPIVDYASVVEGIDAALAQSEQDSAPIEPTDAQLDAAVATIRSSTHPDRGLAYDVWKALGSPSAAVGHGVERLAALLCNDPDARRIAEQKFALSFDESHIETQEYWRTIARTAILALTPTGSAEPAIPAGMVPWAGGQHKPDDFASGKVMLRNGYIIWDPMRWTHSDPQGNLRPFDVVAYTPKPTPAASPDSGEAVREALEQALAWAYIQGATDVHDEWGRDPDDRPRGDPDFAEAAGDYAKAAVDPFSSAARIPEALHAALTSPSIGQDSAAIPAGYVMVPREPTEAMMNAGAHAHTGIAAQRQTWTEITKSAWSAMIAASPQPTQDRSDLNNGGGR